MQAFSFSTTPIDAAACRAAVEDPACGGFVSFEGWVRNHNEGREVRALEYEAFAALAVREGERIVAEAVAKFGVRHAACVHRIGGLELGDMAVWVGVSSAHRDEAFAACRYVIDAVKHRVPIWKKEHYVDGDSGWVNCERCAAGGDNVHAALGGRHEDDEAVHGAHDHAGHGAHGHGHGDHAHTRAAGPDYSRQMALPEVGREGQAMLARGSVLVIGAGGLGVPVLQYLVAAGVGRVGIVDGDVVEASNLHRQPLYGPTDVGRSKAQVAAERLHALNPGVTLDVQDEHATAGNLDAWLAHYDLVVECSDNFATKFLVNDAAVAARKPAVYASVYQYEGQLQVYVPRDDWPCLRCLWPEAPHDGLVGNCAQAGVLGPVPATLGAMQAMQALKLLLGLPPEPEAALHAFDLLGMHWRTLKARRRAACDHDTPKASDHFPGGHDALELHFASLAQARTAGYTLVDIREDAECVHDAPEWRADRRVPLSQLLDDDMPLATGGRYLLLCAYGVRSRALAQRLHAQGRRDVWSLAGGLAAVD